MTNEKTEDNGQHKENIESSNEELELDKNLAHLETMLQEINMEQELVKDPQLEETKKELDNALQVLEKIIKDDEPAIIFNLLDEIIADLRRKTAEIDDSLKETKSAAIKFCNDLVSAKNVYKFNSLKDNISTNEAKSILIDSCRIAVDTAVKAIPEKVGRATYFKDILKEIANVFISAAQKLGFSATFFTTAKETKTKTCAEIKSSLASLKNQEREKENEAENTAQNKSAP